MQTLNWWEEKILDCVVPQHFHMSHSYLLQFYQRQIIDSELSMKTMLMLWVDKGRDKNRVEEAQGDIRTVPKTETECLSIAQQSFPVTGELFPIMRE